MGIRGTAVAAGKALAKQVVKSVAAVGGSGAIEQAEPPRIDEENR